MTNETAGAILEPTIPPDVMEKVVIGGDLAELNAAQRADYYTAVCRSLGLNPLTTPFQYLTLNGKLRLYALRDCADQLRRIHGISIYIVNRERIGDIYVVTARAKDRMGREDESTGAVHLGNLKGDALCNALMRGETKAKRRVTLSIAGLGCLDETELETIPHANTLCTRDGDPLPAELTTSQPDPLPDGEPHAPAPGDRHPTVDEVNRLVECALAANHTMEAFGADMRRLMGLPETQKITKKFLRETMTMAQYEKARAQYGELLRQILEGDVPAFDAPAQGHGEGSRRTGAAQGDITSNDVAEPPPREPTPAEDPAEKDRAIVRELALGWGLPEIEVDHVLTHHRDPQHARNLLWKAKQRRQQLPDPQQSLTDAAAD